MEKFLTRLKKLSKVSWLAEILAIAGALIYSAQIWIYAHTQDTVLDEGLYLLKGYLFATGKYTPFESYGPLTNKMPLAFLIPGYVQRLFVPGLRTGRHLAIALSILFLVGVWMVAKRLGGKWGGVAAVFMVALNPANLKLYSLMISEGLIAAMLIWVLVLTLGEKRPLWQLIMGASLAGLMPLTRINMSPILPFLLAYIFWEHGIRKGLWASAAGLTAFIGGHALFWPGIMSNWLPWIPAKMTPFLDAWRPVYDHGKQVWDPQITSQARFMSFLEGIRFHFAALMGAITSWLLWPKKWSKHSNFKIAVFLSSLFILLLGLHGWVSLLKGSNVFGFSVYLSFFEVLGILLLIVTFKDWRWELPKWRRYLAVIVLVFVLFGVAYTGAGPRTIPGKLIGWVLMRRAPYFDEGQIKFAPYPWWKALKNTFGWTYANIVLIGSRVMLVTLAAGVLVASLRLAKRLIALDQERFSPKMTISIALVFVLGMGIIASPLEVLGGGRHDYDCHKNVIATYETAAEHISQYVEEGDRVYWKGNSTQVLLAELGLIELFPQQLNAIFSYYQGGDSEMLAKYGLWNDELDQQWAREANIFLIEEKYLNGWLVDYIYRSEGLFDEKEPPPLAGCREGANIIVIERVQ